MDSKSNSVQSQKTIKCIFWGEVETIFITVRIFISYFALGSKGLIENHTGLSESELRREFKFKVGVCPMNEDV